MGKHKKKSGGAFGNRTSLDRHKHVGKSLIPPLAQLPKSKPSSWINERLPDYLWAVILLGSAERDPVLGLFRQIADDVFHHKDVADIDDLRWSPKVGQDGSLIQTQKNDSHVQETTSAQS